jgi:hypothetical protein
MAAVARLDYLIGSIGASFVVELVSPALDRYRDTKNRAWLNDPSSDGDQRGRRGWGAAGSPGRLTISVLGEIVS